MAAQSTYKESENKFDREHAKIKTVYGVELSKGKCERQGTREEDSCLEEDGIVSTTDTTDNDVELYELELDFDDKDKDDIAAPGVHVSENLGANRGKSNVSQRDILPKEVHVPKKPRTSRAKSNVSQRDVLSYDKREQEREERLFGKDASPCCRRKCTVKIPRDLAVNSRRCFAELTKKEQDLVLLAHLQSHQRLPCLQDHYGEETKRGSVRKRATTDNSFRRGVRYMCHDIEICRTLFYFIYDVSEKRMRNLMRYYVKNNLSIREHGSTGKLSTNKQVITLPERQEVIEFIRTYAEEHALLLSGRMPDCKNNHDRVLKLPAAVTKAEVYRAYRNAVTARQKDSSQNIEQPCMEGGMQLLRIVGRRSFQNIWSSHLPHVLVTKPVSNLRTHTSNIIV